MTLCRWIIEYPNEAPRAYEEPSVRAWVGVLDRYIAAPDMWTLDEITPAWIVFVGRGAWIGCKATFIIPK